MKTIPGARIPIGGLNTRTQLKGQIICDPPTASLNKGIPSAKASKRFENSIKPTLCQSATFLASTLKRGQEKKTTNGGRRKLWSASFPLTVAPILNPECPNCRNQQRERLRGNGEKVHDQQTTTTRPPHTEEDNGNADERRGPKNKQCCCLCLFPSCLASSSFWVNPRSCH